MTPLLRWALVAQGLLYVVTGVWSVLHRRSFEAVTGPKSDYWLVRMVGLLSLVTGATLLYFAAQPQVAAWRGGVAILSIGSAAAFAAIDIVYASTRRISRVYLADAVLEIVLLCCVAFGLSRPPAAPSAPAGPTAERTDSDSALAVLRAYYAAIDERDYARAFAMWGSGGPPGDPSLTRFAAGFAGTDSSRVVVGARGRVEGAAGSRYLSVNVTVDAFEHDSTTVYEGTYTLRRTVVPGAPPSDARWHLYQASLRRVH